MQQTYTTTRLTLARLTETDTAFIAELVNTPTWIQNIGERNVKTKEAARYYVEQLLNNSSVCYWVVRLATVPIGVITLIKRTYLEHQDIGFAFLPAYTKQGYAQEATLTVLDDLLNDTIPVTLLATTSITNKSSIQLLQKLGFAFQREIQVGNEVLQLYAITTPKFLITQQVHLFFDSFTTIHQAPCLERLHTICMPETVLIKKDSNCETVYTLTTFIEPRQQLLTDGTLTAFKEHEISEQTTIVGNLASRISRYEKSGYLHGVYFKDYGTKFFQFINTSKGWQLYALCWEDDKK